MKSNGRSGKIRENLSGQLAFSSFVPADLQDIRIQYTDEMVRLLGEAYLLLGRYTEKWNQLSEEERKAQWKDAASMETEASVRLSIDTGKEAELMAGGISSGAPLKLDLTGDPGVFMKNANKPVLSPKDVKDLEWLRESVSYAMERMKELPLSLRFISEIHDYALHASHNYDNMPGEFRRSPNWMGPRGTTLNTAAYVPPVPEDMKRSLYRLEEYMHEEDGADPLICAALIHYQFEMIHPFLDGNGRVGRLFVQLYLVDKGIIPAPILTFSEILRKREARYYRSFSQVEEDGRYEELILFWLNVFIEDLVKRTGAFQFKACVRCWLQ